MSCGLGYKPKVRGPRAGFGVIRLDEREMNRKGLMTSEVIVDGQWGVSDTQSKGVRRMEDGRGGSVGEMGEAEADDTWRTKTG